MKRESAEALDRMFGRMVREFGSEAEHVLRVLAEELGGFRLTFPDVQDIERMARNKTICDRFTGCNYDELAARFSLHPSQVRRIVEGQRNIPTAYHRHLSKKMMRNKNFSHVLPERAQNL